MFSNIREILVTLFAIIVFSMSIGSYVQANKMSQNMYRSISMDENSTMIMQDYRLFAPYESGTGIKGTEVLNFLMTGKSNIRVDGVDLMIPQNESQYNTILNAIGTNTYSSSLIKDSNEVIRGINFTKE